MSDRAGALWRLGLMLAAAVVLQISGLAQIHLLGGTADVVPLVVAAVALFAGSVPGAGTGFCAGLLLDLALGHSLGASSLVLTAVGYAVGRYTEARDPGHGLVAIPVGAAATAGYAVGTAIVNFMLEIGASVSALVLREMLVTVFLNALLALPVFALVRRVLRPVLAVDPRRRRRSAQPTGPIGLRGLEV